MRFKSLLALGDPKSFCHVYLSMSMRRWKLSDPPTVTTLLHNDGQNLGGVTSFHCSPGGEVAPKRQPEFVDYRLSPDHWRWTQAVILLLLCLVQQTVLCVFLHVCSFSINKKALALTEVYFCLFACLPCHCNLQWPLRANASIALIFSCKWATLCDS